MTAPEKSVIVDTDPGQDDAIALLLALASPELRILGITAVAGNVSVEKTYQNARRLCALAGRSDVPVFQGCDRPLVRRLLTADHIHGETGLDGAVLPEATAAAERRHAVDWIVESILGAPAGSVTICALGPLTNVASALVREPALAHRIDRIVLMGGSAFRGGNVTPAAEFNIHVDPHAADIVFRSGIPITMMPLDVTHQALLPVDWADNLRKLSTRTGKTVGDLIAFYRRHDPDRYGQTGGPLHDPCVVAYLLAPDLFGGKDCTVCIETQSPLTLGMTVVDWWRKSGSRPTATVITELDRERFFQLLIERIARLP